MTTSQSQFERAQEEMAHTSIRFGIGRFTTEAEVQCTPFSPPPDDPKKHLHRLCARAQIDYAMEMCIKHVERLRSMSPLYEMVQEGIDLKTIQWSQH